VYSFDSAGKFSRGLGWETNIDNLFFPSILCYPYVLKPDKVSEFVEPPFSTGSILGIRILQLLAAHSVRVQNKESPSLLSVKEVQEICRILFNYPSDLVKCTIEAYHEFEFLELQNHTFYHNASAALIREMPKLWWVIQEFLYNIAYLNLCSLRAPLSNKVLGGDNPFIRAATLEPRTENVADEDWHQRTVQWVGSKILNSISVYHLLSAINASQCKLANSRLNELDPRLRATVQKAIEGHEGVQGMFDFPKKTKLAIIEQTNAIFDTFNRVSNLEGFLEHYLRGYCSTYLRGEPTTPSQAP
jgi:hypothetical protein